MIFILVVGLFIFLIYIIFVKHIVIDFKTFFKKGFKKFDNAFRRILLYAGSKVRARLCLLVNS